jgi:hypothetical protein
MFPFPRPIELGFFFMVPLREEKALRDQYSLKNDPRISHILFAARGAP